MQKINNQAKRVAINTGLLYLRMAITVFISLYTTRLILNSLGASDFGIFNVVGGAIAMLTFLNTSMTAATQRFMSYSQGEGNIEKQKRIFNVSIVLHLLIAVLVVLLLVIVGYFLFNGILKIPCDRIEAAKLIFYFLIASTFFTILSVPYDAVINAHENMLFVAVVGIIEAVLKLCIAIYISYAPFDKLKIYGFLMALLSLILLLTIRFYCSKKYNEVQINLKKYNDKKIFKEMSIFAGWSLLSCSASMITMQGVSIILNSFFGVIINAAQGVANQISGQLMAFSNTMLKALNPLIVKSEGENNRDQMLKAAITGNKLSYFLLAFFSVPTIIEMPYILGIWLKNTPEYAVIFCRLSLIRLMLSQLTTTFSTAIGATGKIKQIQIFESIIYILLLPISYIMFKQGASPEAIYVNLIFMVVSLFFVRIYITHRICGLSIKTFFFDTIIPCFIVSLGTTIISIFPILVITQNLTRLISVLTLSFTSSTILIYIFGFNSNEKSVFISIIKTVYSKLKK